MVNLWNYLPPTACRLTAPPSRGTMAKLAAIRLAESAAQLETKAMKARCYINLRTKSHEGVDIEGFDLNDILAKIKRKYRTVVSVVIVVVLV